MWPRLLLVSLALASAGADWRNDCRHLNDRSVAPFLYHSQSDLAVLAFFDPSAINYNDFDQGKRLVFDIVPICFVKGFVNEPNLQVITGTQRCGVTPLRRMQEYPSLFFLKKQRSSDKWLLLNSGEYLHIVHNRGILFGVGPGGSDFPQMCGVTRRRTAIDQGRCRSTKCKAYCSYAVAAPDKCLDAQQLLRSKMPTPPPPRSAHVDAPVETEVRKKEEKKEGGPGGAASGPERPAALSVATVAALGLMTVR